MKKRLNITEQIVDTVKSEIADEVKSFLEKTRVMFCGQRDCIYNMSCKCSTQLISIGGIEFREPVCRMYTKKDVKNEIKSNDSNAS